MLALARWLAAIAIVLACAPVLAGERSGPEPEFPFPAGSLLGHSELQRARDWLPPEARAHLALLLPASGQIHLGAPRRIVAPAASDCGGDPAAAAREIWSLLRASEIGRGALWSYGRREKRGDETVTGDARGVTILRYRGDAAAVGDGARSDFWIYLPERPAPRDEAARPAKSWSCLGRVDLLAPLAGRDGETETWALQKAWGIRFETEHPAGAGPRSVLYLDGASRKPLFAFSYDGRGALRRIVIADRRVVDVEPHEPGSNAVRE